MSLRKTTALPGDVVRDLEAIDRALEGAAVDADQRELAELALAVRDERPLPAPGFAAQLDERAAAGFRPSRPASPARRPLPWLPAAGAVASVAVATAVAVSLNAGDSSRLPDERPSVAQQTSPAPALRSGGGVAGSAAPALVSPGEAGDPASADSGAPPASARPRAQSTTPENESSLSVPLLPSPSPPPSGGTADDAARRSVERGVNLRLATSPKGLDDVAQGVVRVTDAVGGYVRSSTVDSRPGLGGGASFDLQIPVARLQSALSRLSQLAKVRSRTESSVDVTGQVVLARNRAAARKAERRALLRQLEAAKSVSETARIRERLRSIEARLREANAARAGLRRRTAYSAVAVQVVTERGGAAAAPSKWTPSDALGDARRVLEVFAGVALVALAVLVPLSLLLLLLWPLARVGQRRRREQALETSQSPASSA